MKKSVASVVSIDRGKPQAGPEQPPPASLQPAKGKRSNQYTLTNSLMRVVRLDEAVPFAAKKAGELSHYPTDRVVREMARLWVQGQESKGYSIKTVIADAIRRAA